MFPQKSSIAFVSNFLNQEIEKYVPITNSGSNRKYFRVYLENRETLILTENQNRTENESFFYFSKIFKKNINIPEVLAVNQDKTIYLQEDIGDASLFSMLSNNGFTPEIYQHFENSLMQLAQLQLQYKDKIDYSKCYDFQVFDEKVVQNDLFYFKNYFLDRLSFDYSKRDFAIEVDRISDAVKKLQSPYFLYRDFQSRNVFMKDEKPYFIDFQGGMKGFLGYDLVSILFQAKANLPSEWKEHLKKQYFSFFEEYEKMSKETLEESYRVSMILRFFQLFGAYGLRGLVERKPHFIESIMFHNNNINCLLENGYLENLPQMEKISRFIVSEDSLQQIKNIILE